MLARRAFDDIEAIRTTIGEAVCGSRPLSHAQNHSNFGGIEELTERHSFPGHPVGTEERGRS